MNLFGLYVNTNGDLIQMVFGKRLICSKKKFILTYLSCYYKYYYLKIEIAVSWSGSMAFWE